MAVTQLSSTTRTSGPPTDEALVEAGPAMVQLLTPAGDRTPDAEHDPLVAHLDAQALRERYRAMALARRLDIEATSLQRQGELALYASSRGQEAAQIGAAHALRPQDHVFPTYREHALAMSRGVAPLDLLRLYRGTSHGGWDASETNTHGYTLVIGAQTLHATGYAMGVQRDQSVGTGDPEVDTAVLACLGDGATAQGEVNEALTWSAVFQAPVVFLCQNNQWAISEPNERQFAAPLTERAAGFGLPAVRVDGNDVIAVEAVLRAAADRARSGGGPSFVEAWTYRVSAHTTSDDTTRYREAEHDAHWAPLDPLTRLEAHLRAIEAGGADASAGEQDVDALLADLAVEADALGESLRSGVRSLPDPLPESMFDHVYADPHPLIDAERSWMQDWNAEGEQP